MKSDEACLRKQADGLTNQGNVMVETASDLLAMVHPFLDDSCAADFVLDASDDKEDKCAIIWF